MDITRYLSIFPASEDDAVEEASELTQEIVYPFPRSKLLRPMLMLESLLWREELESVLYEDGAEKYALEVKQLSEEPKQVTAYLQARFRRKFRRQLRRRITDAQYKAQSDAYDVYLVEKAKAEARAAEIAKNPELAETLEPLPTPVKPVLSDFNHLSPAPLAVPEYKYKQRRRADPRPLLGRSSEVVFDEQTWNEDTFS